MHLLDALQYIWIAFGVYWVAAGVKSKKSQTHESHGYRFVRLGILVLVFVLLFWSRASIGILGRRFVPFSAWISYVGFAVTLAGLGIALCARVHLGQYWSDKVVLKVDHQLIRTGPYAHMRHPIYSGVLLAVLGTALVLGEWRGLTAFVVLLANYWIKAKREDLILSTQFGEKFREHETRAGFLLPRFPPRQ